MLNVNRARRNMREPRRLHTARGLHGTIVGGEISSALPGSHLKALACRATNGVSVGQSGRASVCQGGRASVG
jgi:hypothetical protein